MWTGSIDFLRSMPLIAQDHSVIIQPFRIDDISPFVVAIVAILAGCGLALMGAIMRHRERMAMIQQGMHPDDSHARAHYKEAKKKGAVGKEVWNDYQPPA